MTRRPAAARFPVAITQNFEHNLDDIEQVLGPDGAPLFAALLALLFDKVIPDLAAFPDLGFDFLQRRPHSVDAAARIARLQARLGDGTAIREYLTGDYLFLYAVRPSRIFLLSIRHHRQLSYDLRAQWVPAHP